ncbi:MAG: DinB family protein [Bacteroidota bacterium]
MTIKHNDLIDDLIDRTKDNLNQLEQLREFPDIQLNHKPAADSWSAFECFEHLNRYGDFYLKAIATALAKGRPASANTVFKSGWLGNRFAMDMLPGEKMKKINTFANKNPNGSKLDRAVLDKCINQQIQMLELLSKARQVDLTRLRIPTTLASWLRLRAGDIFRVVIYHIQRHLVQARAAVKTFNTKAILF